MALTHERWFRVPDRRTMAGIALGALAAVLVLIVTRPGTSIEVLVGSTDLPAGKPLEGLEIETRSVEDPTGLVPAKRLEDLSEWVLGRRLLAGEPIPASLLEPPELQAAPSLMALELDAGHAVLGRLSAGDLIDVYATRPTMLNEPAETELIASRVFVVEAEVTETTIGNRTVRLLLAVDDGLADRLTAASRTSDIDLVRVQP